MTQTAATTTRQANKVPVDGQYKTSPRPSRKKNRPSTGPMSTSTTILCRIHSMASASAMLHVTSAAARCFVWHSTYAITATRGFGNATFTLSAAHQPACAVGHGGADTGQQIGSLHTLLTISSQRPRHPRQPCTLVPKIWYQTTKNPPINSPTSGHNTS